MLRCASLGLCTVLWAIWASAPACAQSENLINPAAQAGKTSSSFGVVTNPFTAPATKINKASPLLLEGDELVYDTRNNRVIARGKVEIYYDGFIMLADEVIYDQGANTLTAKGNAQLKQPTGEIIHADRIVTTDDFRDAFVQSLSLVGKDESRIVARRAVRKDGNISEFEDGKFTPCKNDPGTPPLWCISARRIVHDAQDATINYQDAQFEVYGVPVFYMPYFTHPDPSVKRASGFLTPFVSYNTTLGYSTTIPYYFALSPYYDFTFTGRYFSQHGALYMGEWRHSVAVGGAEGWYSVKFAGLNQDGSTLPGDLSDERRALYNGWRGSVQTMANFSLASWWRFGWDITVESDDTFRRFYRLDSLVVADRVNTAFLEGLSERNFLGIRFYQFGGLMVESTSLTESMVHPVVDYRYILGQPVLGGELSFAGNALSLSRKDGTDMQRVSGELSWRRKLIDPIGQTWTPFLNARADLTHFTNGFDPDLATSIPAETVVRGMGSVGVTYAYPFVAHTTNTTHVVEPIGQVVARPGNLSQRRLPDEDAKSLVFDDTLLFDTNKFSGWDRQETGTRANVGLQYTFQSRSGPYARLIAGQSFHLSGENAFVDPGYVPSGTDGTKVANFAPHSGLETSKSDYVLGAYLAPINNFRVISQARFNDTELSLRRANVLLDTRIGPVTLQTQYSYTRDEPDIGLFASQSEVSGQAGIRLTDRWTALLGVRYDIDSRFMLQDQLILKYSDECFVLTATYTESFINDPTRDIKPDRSILLRFEWKYLGDVKYGINQVDNIFGSSTTPR